MALRIAAVAALLAAASLGAEAPDARVDALFAAARAGDAAAVARLLADGVNVNAKGRYDTTALFFAADKGNLAVVELLVSRGANVAVRDTFYGATPLSWAADRGHGEVARLLVERGAPEPESALELAVKTADAALARAILNRGPLAAPARARSLAAAREAPSALLVALLESAEVRPEPEVPVPAERLQRLVGEYAGDRQAGLRIELSEGGLRARGPGGESWRLVPVGDDRFRTADAADVWVSFEGRAGTVEWAGVQQGARLTYFRRASAAESADAPAAASVNRNPEAAPRARARPWPSFRGSNADGIGDGQGAPTSWDLAAGTNVLWKTPIPGFGNSSPIVWGDRIYLTTAVGPKEATFRTGLYGDVDPVPEEAPQSWRLLGLDRRTGRVLFERTVHEGRPRVKRHTKSTHANPTPATDGRHVVAMFGSEGLFAFDMDGRVLWKKDLGTLDSGWFYDPTYQWGFSSSPILYEGSVIAQVDLQKGSFIAAWDLASGRELWRTPREEISTFGTPTVVLGPKGDELVTNGTTVRSYDPRTGALLWTLGPNSEITVATPVAADGVVYVTAGYPPVQPVYAVRVGARGKLDLEPDRTSSAEVAWSATKGGTYIPTPIVYRGHLYTLHNNGRLLCYDARTGAVVYGRRVGTGGTFTASPVAADGRLFIATEEGDVFVVRAGPEFDVLASNTVGEPVMATPAISDGVLLVRTLRTLHAFGRPSEQAR